ncbi:FAD-dependent oxidoreductase [Alteromonadaceae bacterium BrNp21-10]|nr:FAD-dependent oxidoreductase [Alteromonadaceae bacterium BrNp21-10]
MRKVDVVIVGGGMVGLTLALALKNSVLQVAVIDSQPAGNALSDTPELRVSAINVASENVLRAVGAWDAISSARLQAYTHMQVWEQDSFAKIEFDHQQVQQPHLGHIIENQVIRQSLWQQAEQASNITLLAPETIQQLAFGEREVFVNLASGEMLTASLVVGADGGNSWVRQQANLPITFWDYEHTAIVATVKTELPHGNTARQIFTPTGPLAFLPLWQKDVCSIVWSQQQQSAETILAMDDEQFNHALTAAFDGRLGVCTVQSQRQSYPLRMRYARQMVGERVALIGDAAHTIHPLAGQGVNLGILDAAALAQTLIDLQRQRKDIGQLKHLRAYGRWRKTEAMKLVLGMEGFKRLFNGANPLQKLLRGVGMNMVNQFPPARNAAIKNAMGLEGELPELALPEFARGQQAS